MRPGWSDLQRISGSRRDLPMRHAALAGGAPILCDARMVSEGITRARLPGQRTICTLQDPAVDLRKIGNTRSAAALELWRPILAGAVVAIGNAPTALFHLLNMLEDPACPRPAAIIGCPVGFGQSKAALGRSSCTLLRRRGPPGRQCHHRGGHQRAGEYGRMNAGTNIGTIHGVGLGPGAADLLSVRADRLAHGAPRRLFPLGGPARQGIVEGMLRADVIEFPMEYPVTTEIPVSDPRYNACLSAFYTHCSERLAAISQQGEDVVVLCEGDPFFYGSFMHLHARLSGRIPVEVVPASRACLAPDRDGPADHLGR